MIWGQILQFELAANVTIAVVFLLFIARCVVAALGIMLLGAGTLRELIGSFFDLFEYAIFRWRRFRRYWRAK